jgi:hypothetical protein
MAWAAGLGRALPLLFSLFRLGPGVPAGPIASPFAALAALLLYLLLARALVEDTGTSPTPRPPGKPAAPVKKAPLKKAARSGER